jgi:hypothetical protein
MQHDRHSLAIAILVTVQTAGCGGGGSSMSSDWAAIRRRPAEATQEPTRAQTRTQHPRWSSLPFWQPPLFSSCSGSAAALSITITCTGSIDPAGTLKVSGTDSDGNSLSFLGDATTARATSTYSIKPAKVVGSFLCKR